MSVDSQKHDEFAVFVGNALAFSDNILRHAQAEFACVQFNRIGDVEALLSLSEEMAERCALIVVDDGQADDLRQNILVLNERFRKSRFALAYRQAAIAHGFLKHASGHPQLAKVGILPMRLEIDHWLSVLRLLIGGERYIPFELFENTHPAAPKASPAEKPAPLKRKTTLPPLTEREIQVLSSVSEGKQNKIIAAEMDLSEHTVKLHIHNVISKLGVNNRTEAAIRFLADQSKPTDGSH